MLDTPAFLTTYLSGAFKPEAVMMYGKTHRIVINRMMVPDRAEPSWGRSL